MSILKGPVRAINNSTVMDIATLQLSHKTNHRNWKHNYNYANLDRTNLSRSICCLDWLKWKWRFWGWRWMWSKALSKTTPVSGSFTVPSSATTGSTRMRAPWALMSTVSLWDSNTYGEVEDYSVNIVVMPNTSPPTIPTNLAWNQASSTNLSWTASTDDVAVTGYNIYNGSEMVASASGTSYK
jgi:hypothetical protein